MRGLDHGERHHAERGQDVVLKRSPIDAGGMGVAVLRDVGAQVALSEVCDGGAGLGRGAGIGSLPPLMRSMTWAGAEPGLRGGELARGSRGVTRFGPPWPRLWTT